MIPFHRTVTRIKNKLNEIKFTKKWIGKFFLLLKPAKFCVIFYVVLRYSLAIELRKKNYNNKEQAIPPSGLCIIKPTPT